MHVGGGVEDRAGAEPQHRADDQHHDEVAHERRTGEQRHLHRVGRVGERRQERDREDPRQAQRQWHHQRVDRVAPRGQIERQSERVPRRDGKTNGSLSGHRKSAKGRRLTLERGLLMSRNMNRRLSHIDSSGRVRMVDVSAKPVTARQATARAARRSCTATPSRLLCEGRDAERRRDLHRPSRRRAWRRSARATSSRSPHPIPIDSVDLIFAPMSTTSSVGIEARVALARAHRGRDGGADRGRRGGAHALRHAQGGGPRHGDGRVRVVGEARRTHVASTAAAR